MEEISGLSTSLDDISIAQRVGMSLAGWVADMLVKRDPQIVHFFSLNGPSCF